MQKPKVSILMPTYHRPMLIKRALQSIYKQDFQDWELIIIENGSTPEIHEQYADEVVATLPKDLRIVWLTAELQELTKSQRFPRALNMGFEKSQGKYIAVLEDDDEWKPKFLSTLSRHLDSHFCGMVYAFQIEIEDGRPTIKGTPIPEGQFERLRLLAGNWIGFPMVMMRREALELIGGFYEAAGPALDWITWCSISRSWQICAIRKILVVHHWHGKKGAAEHLCLTDAVRDIRYTILQRRMLARGEFGPLPRAQPRA